MNNDPIRKRRHSSDGVNSEEALRTLQLFRTGSVEFGIFSDDIAAVSAWRQPTPLPQAPKSVLGVVSIQGRMLTVLDLATLTGVEIGSNNAQAQHLIALRGDEQLALAVETLGEAIEIAENDLNLKRDNGESLVLGVLHRKGTEINILDAGELFQTAIRGRERRRRRF